jgi:hypothetical protein
MKLLAVAVFLTGISAVAQRPGGAGFGRMINPGGVSAGPGGGPGAGFGRLIYPGTGGPVTARGVRPGGYVRPPAVVHPQNHVGAVIVPYPVFYGGDYYGYDAPPAPNAGGYYYDPSGARQDSPVVIINQSYQPDTVNPSFQDYSNTQLPPPALRRRDNPSQPDNGAAAQANPPDDQPSVYLIALKDHTIFAAIGYWVDGDTVNYITQDNVHNRVAMDLIDRAFTKQLNDERHIDLRLPPEK